jgi:S-formylglutathione hydrolase FrmB
VRGASRPLIPQSCAFGALQVNQAISIDGRAPVRSAKLPLHAFVLVVASLMLAAPVVFAKTIEQGRIVVDVLHGKSLENTVTDESADRKVLVYLPPSYEKVATRRYPVIYLLHGIGGTGEEWVKNEGDWASIQSVMNNGIAAGLIREMIVVLPNQQTRRFGSFYTNSTVTGRWEDFTTRELVKFVDGKYRTLATAASRGIAGHSMGGYGALKLGMQYPDVYSVVYGMNPALIGWGGDLTALNPAFIAATRAKSFDEIPPPGYAAGIVTAAQAFSPNPNKPPFYVDLPYAEVDGKVVPAEPAFSAWEANAIVNMVPKYRANLTRLRGLRFDSGYADSFQFIPVNARALSLELTTYGVDHVFEEYNGDHQNRMFGRTGRLSTEVLPYFSLLLEPQAP